MSSTPASSTPSSSAPTSQQQQQQQQQASSPGDLLKALDNALQFAASKPEAARQIADALKSHMPGLVQLAQEGRLTQSQFQQLEALMKSGTQAQASANGWTNGRPAAQRTQTAPAQAAASAASAHYTSPYYANGSSAAAAAAAAPVPQEYDEREWLRLTIQRMAYEQDPEAVLEKDSEELLIEAVFDFVRNTTEFGSRLARHRGSDVLQVRDVQLYLERHLGIRVPGFATEETRQPLSDLPVAANTRSAKAGRK